MPELGPETLNELASQTGYPRVTIHTPMVRAGKEVRQNRIRLTNAASRAIEMLQAQGAEEADAQALVQPVLDLAGDEHRMEHQLHGLSLFVDDAGYQELQVPMELPSRVEVGSRFAVAPLVEPAVNNEEYGLLALSEGGVGLYRASRFAAEAIELAGLPEDLCYVLRFDEFEKSSGHHHTTSARGDSVQHGHGMGKDEHDAFIKRFVDTVEPVVRQWCEQQSLPLVVVGSEDVVGHYLKENRYGETASEHRFVDPHSQNIDDVIRVGWECMHPRAEARRQDAVNRFHAAEHRAVDVYSVLPALVEGRAATLFVSPHQQLRGTFDPRTVAVHVDDDPAHATENLVDATVAYGLASGTEIIPVTDEIRTPAAILH